MKCELNLQTGGLAGHDQPAAWRATNALGASFALCDDCVQSYRKRRAGEAGTVNFERLEKGDNSPKSGQLSPITPEVA